MRPLQKYFLPIFKSTQKPKHSKPTLMLLIGMPSFPALKRPQGLDAAMDKSQLTRAVGLLQSAIIFPITFEGSCNTHSKGQHNRKVLHRVAQNQRTLFLGFS